MCESVLNSDLWGISENKLSFIEDSIFNTLRRELNFLENCMNILNDLVTTT